MLGLLLLLVVLGFVCYLVLTFVPMAPPFKQVFVFVVVLILVVVLVNMFLPGHLNLPPL